MKTPIQVTNFNRNGKSVNQVEFNPKYRMAMIISSAYLELYEVDGEKNQYLQNFKFPYTNQPCGKFKSDGGSIIFASGNYKGGEFYSCDLTTKKVSRNALIVGNTPKKFDKFVVDGDLMVCTDSEGTEVYLLSTKTYEVQSTLKVNDKVVSAQMDNENQIYILTSNGSVYIWDTRQQSKCKHKFKDETSVASTHLSIHPDAGLITMASNTGSINIFKIDDCMATKFPAPIETFDRFDEIVALKFNKDILLATSEKKIRAFAYNDFHKNSKYGQFPKLGKIRDASLSPSNGYVSVGLTSGKVCLFKCQSYGDY